MAALGRVLWLQRHVGYLGEIRPSQERAWRSKSIEMLDEHADDVRMLLSFPKARCILLRDGWPIRSVCRTPCSVCLDEYLGWDTKPLVQTSDHGDGERALTG